MLVVVLCNVFGTPYLEEREVRSLDLSDPLYVATRRFEDRSESLKVPSKTKKRVLYISNSHSFTGGRVVAHLQKLLESAAPGEFELFDLSIHGIFGPEILQRIASGIDFNPDVIIFAVFYICFNDRMNLQDQNLTAQSFFRSDVFPKLPFLFWLRDFDINVFADRGSMKIIPLLRYRDTLRASLERPLAAWLKGVTSDTRKILFLNAGQKKTWHNPDRFGGMNNSLMHENTFQRVHLADLASAVDLARASGGQVVGLTMPINFSRFFPSKITPSNLGEFRGEVKEIFEGSALYEDLQDSYATPNFTYDGLHPNVHGARLHALDLFLRLSQLGLISPTSFERVEETYSLMVASDESCYKSSLDKVESETSRDLKRFNIFSSGLNFLDEDEMRVVFTILFSHPLGSYSEKVLSAAIEDRIKEFGVFNESCPKTQVRNQPIWCKMFELEKGSFGSKLKRFTEVYREIQLKRISSSSFR